MLRGMEQPRSSLKITFKTGNLHPKCLLVFMHPGNFHCWPDPSIWLGRCYQAKAGPCYHCSTLQTCVFSVTDMIGTFSDLLSAALLSLFKSPSRMIMSKWLRAWWISKYEAALCKEAEGLKNCRQVNNMGTKKLPNWLKFCGSQFKRIGRIEMWIEWNKVDL